MTSQTEMNGQTEFGTEQVQTLRIPFRPTKLKKDQYVLGKPLKLYWDRNRTPLIRCSLESTSSSWLLGDTLIAEKNDDQLEMFASQQSVNRYKTSMQASATYSCGPLKFAWNRGMLCAENMFIFEDAPLGFSHISIIFQG